METGSNADTEYGVNCTLFTGFRELKPFAEIGTRKCNSRSKNRTCDLFGIINHAPVIYTGRLLMRDRYLLLDNAGVIYNPTTQPHYPFE